VKGYESVAVIKYHKQYHPGDHAFIFISGFSRRKSLYHFSGTIIYNKEDLRQLHLKDGLTFKT